MSCDAAIKLFCKILVQKYDVVGIKTVVVYVCVAIKCFMRRVFFLLTVHKVFSQVEHNKLTNKQFMSINNQQPTSIWTIKNCLKEFHQWRDSRKKYSIQSGDIKLLMGKDCEMEKILKETNIFKEM